MMEFTGEPVVRETPNPLIREGGDSGNLNSFVNRQRVASKDRVPASTRLWGIKKLGPGAGGSAGHYQIHEIADVPSGSNIRGAIRDLMLSCKRRALDEHVRRALYSPEWVTPFHPLQKYEVEIFRVRFGREGPDGVRRFETTAGLSNRGVTLDYPQELFDRDVLLCVEWEYLVTDEPGYGVGLITRSFTSAG